MIGYIIDWSKKPEILVEKKMCPICKLPTGPTSTCEDLINKDTEDDYGFGSDEQGNFKLQVATIDVDGRSEPIFTKQCYYKRHDLWFVYTNFPISSNMALVLSSVEGVERFHVVSSYRAELLIAPNFDTQEVAENVKAQYNMFCEEKKQQIEGAMNFNSMVLDQLDKTIDQLSSSNQQSNLDEESSSEDIFSYDSDDDIEDDMSEKGQ